MRCPILLRRDTSFVTGRTGQFADTGVDTYNDAWFESVEHQADIKWTYGVCRAGQTIRCAPSTFGYVNPFPSIADGMPGKKCQYLNASRHSQGRQTTRASPSFRAKSAWTRTRSARRWI